MKPSRVIAHRDQSPPAMHRPDYLFGCPGHLKLYLDRGVIWEACDRCGRVMQKWCVIPTPPEPQLHGPWEDADNECRCWLCGASANHLIENVWYCPSHAPRRDDDAVGLG